MMLAVFAAVFILLGIAAIGYGVYLHFRVRQ